MYLEMKHIRHPKLQVQTRTGTEGPRYDPYAYTEYTVKTPKGLTVLHTGLGTWIRHNGKMVEKPSGVLYDEWERQLCEEIFPALTGYTLLQLERIARNLTTKCNKCGSTDFTHESGYPGETLVVCIHCGRINGGWFHRSAVE